MLFAGIFALLGVGVGLLLRSTALTVTLLLLWPFVVEPLIYGLLTVMNQEDLGKWLPMRAGFAMLGTVDDDDSELLGPNVAGVYFAVFSAVMSPSACCPPNGATPDPAGVGADRGCLRRGDDPGRFAVGDPGRLRRWWPSGTFRLRNPDLSRPRSCRQGLRGIRVSGRGVRGGRVG